MYKLVHDHFPGTVSVSYYGYILVCIHPSGEIVCFVDGKIGWTKSQTHIENKFLGRSTGLASIIRQDEPKQLV